MQERPHRKDSHSKGINRRFPLPTCLTPIDQDEETALPKLFYSKVKLFLTAIRILLSMVLIPASRGHCIALRSPSRPYARCVRVRNLLLSHSYPELATGGSAMKAVEVLKEHGVPEERIIFINLVATFV